MGMLPELFLKYAEIFKEHGYPLYMVGGSSRDYLLGLEVRDFDFVTPATPDEILAFLPDMKTRFKKFGVLSIKDNGQSLDIVTFRQERGYQDHRHPSDVIFVKDMYLDSLRRDFSINAIYIDRDGTVYDYHEGVKDLCSRTIRFIGNPVTRIQEDPLRILRAKRFAKRLSFELEASTNAAMVELESLLSEINPEKISIEQKKE